MLAYSILVTVKLLIASKCPSGENMPQVVCLFMVIVFILIRVSNREGYKKEFTKIRPKQNFKAEEERKGSFFRQGDLAKPCDEGL